MPWSRASQLDRTLQCPGHLSLPHIRDLSDSAQASADYGTMVHNWKETGIVSGSQSHEKTFAKKLEILKKNNISREYLWPTTGYHEVTFAYNCVDGRVGVCWLSGKAAVEAFKNQYNDEWVTGTADYVGVDSTGHLWVDDLKTGMSFDSSADEMAQMYYYAMVWSKYHRDIVRPVNVTTTHWVKYPLESLPVRSPDLYLTQDKLLKFEKYLCKVYADYKAGKRKFNLGVECDYCPAVLACPLQQKEI